MRKTQRRRGRIRQAALNRDRDASSRGLPDAVRRAVDGFVGDVEQFDGLTMLCPEYRGPRGGFGPVNDRKTLPLPVVSGKGQGRFLYGRHPAVLRNRQPD